MIEPGFNEFMAKSMASSEEKLYNQFDEDNGEINREVDMIAFHDY